MKPTSDRSAGRFDRSSASRTSVSVSGVAGIAVPHGGRRLDRIGTDRLLASPFRPGRASAQARKGTGTMTDPFVLTADDLCKESVASSEKTNQKYAGKFLKVTGTVGGVHDDMLYLPTKATFPGGGVCEVGIRCSHTPP